MHEVAICNKGLMMLGATPITSFDDPSPEARLCRDFYASLRDSVLEQRPWDFAIDRAVLPVFTWPVDRPRPLGSAENCFALPANCLRVIMVAGTEMHNWNDGTYWEVEGQHIYAVSQYLVIRYIFRQENTGMYSPLFVEALATRLAAEWALPLTGSNSAGTQLYEQYLQKMATASIINAQGGNSPQQESRLVAARRQ